MLRVALSLPVPKTAASVFLQLLALSTMHCVGGGYSTTKPRKGFFYFLSTMHYMACGY